MHRPVNARALAPSLAVVALVPLVVLVGCNAGSLDVTVHGTQATDGLAAGAFLDDGRVVFDDVVVSLAQLEVRGATATVVSPGPFLVAVGADDVPVAHFDGLVPGHAEVRVAVVPATSDVANANVDDDLVTLMRDASFAVFVRGTVTQGDRTAGFAWGFGTDTRYVDCALDDDEAPGVEIPTEDPGLVELAVHPERLFAQDVAAPSTSQLRVDAILSADTNEDDFIDIAELAAIELADLPDGYDGGGAFDVTSLFQLISAQSHALVGLRDGPCTGERR